MNLFDVSVCNFRFSAQIWDYLQRFEGITFNVLDGCLCICLWTLQYFLYLSNIIFIQLVDDVIWYCCVCRWKTFFWMSEVGKENNICWCWTVILMLLVLNKLITFAQCWIYSKSKWSNTKSLLLTCWLLWTCDTTPPRCLLLWTPYKQPLFLTSSQKVLFEGLFKIIVYI